MDDPENRAILAFQAAAKKEKPTIEIRLHKTDEVKDQKIIQYTIVRCRKCKYCEKIHPDTLSKIFIGNCSCCGSFLINNYKFTTNAETTILEGVKTPRITVLKKARYYKNLNVAFD